MQLIQTKTLALAAASIEFTSIPQDGTDLVILVSARTTEASAFTGLTVRFNGSTTDYTMVRLFTNSTTPASDSSVGVLILNGSTSTASTFSNVSIYVPNYAGSTNKPFSTDGVAEQNAAANFNGITAGLWSNTSAITSVTLLGAAGNLDTGSTISLYGITKGSDGIVTTS
jgi:hypothetical protein